LKDKAATRHVGGQLSSFHSSACACLVPTSGLCARTRKPDIYWRIAEVLQSMAKKNTLRPAKNCPPMLERCIRDSGNQWGHGIPRNPWEPPYDCAWAVTVSIVGRDPAPSRTVSVRGASAMNLPCTFNRRSLVLRSPPPMTALIAGTSAPCPTARHVRLRRTHISLNKPCISNTPEEVEALLGPNRTNRRRAGTFYISSRKAW